MTPLVKCLSGEQKNLGILTEKEKKLKLMWPSLLTVPGFRRGGQEDDAFKVILRYVRPCLKQ